MGFCYQTGTGATQTTLSLGPQRRSASWQISSLGLGVRSKPTAPTRLVILDPVGGGYWARGTRTLSRRPGGRKARGVKSGQRSPGRSATATPKLAGKGSTTSCYFHRQRRPGRSIRTMSSSPAGGKGSTFAPTALRLACKIGTRRDIGQSKRLEFGWRIPRQPTGKRTRKDLQFTNLPRESVIVESDWATDKQYGGLDRISRCRRTAKIFLGASTVLKINCG
ncbi:hypothetical protein B0I37DRAFT_226485 [Chaetomium sp. MPI-CAGE-AT-0009]|nr:hypothetical protein B0I37DRAFT_226485 [Chaetomium sp. MPI-CAGE-AT-0009]